MSPAVNDGKRSEKTLVRGSILNFLNDSPKEIVFLTPAIILIIFF
jgi:hypothetical protein